jgi:hypothetical protein
MAGILNKKERTIDFLITEEGRRQAAMGELRVRYATFTDHHTFYEASGSFNLARDAQDRLFFEASSRDQDRIIVETNNMFEIMPFKTNDFDIVGRNIVTGSSTTNVKHGIQVETLTGSEVFEVADNLLEDITKNWTELSLIGQFDPFADFSGFRLNYSGSENVMRFSITDNVPIRHNHLRVCQLESCDSLFQDRRLSHLPNFLYLPPRDRKRPGEPEGIPLGLYPDVRNRPRQHLGLGASMVTSGLAADTSPMTYQDLMDELQDKPYKEVQFIETSRDNNIVAQFFEFTENDIQKLAIIDFGSFIDEDQISPGKRVFFVGKIVIDNDGAHTYLNLFTVVFD